MKITPLDIEKHEFSLRFRGYEPEEVRAFLRLVAEDYEAVSKEVLSLRSRVSQLEEDLSAHKEREKILKNTLLTAQKMSEDMKARALTDADLLLKEAEVKADRIVAQAQGRATKIENSIAELKIIKGQLRQKVRATVELVENVMRVQDEEDAADEKLRFLKRETLLSDDLTGS